jgi:alpha-1,3-glucosyltransferase
MLVSNMATYSLLPLLFRPEEFLVKILLMLIHTCCIHLLLGTMAAPDSGVDAAATAQTPLALLSRLDTWKCRAAKLFSFGLVPLEVFCSVVHPSLFGGRLEFLPLMLTSVYCGSGMLFAWSCMAVEYIAGP